VKQSSLVAVTAVTLAVAVASAVAQAQTFPDLGHALYARGYTGSVWVNSFDPSQPYLAHGVFYPETPFSSNGGYDPRYGMEITGSGTPAVDANGLFSASGTQMALDQGLPGIAAVLMGVVTAIFGGVLRDIVCNDIPATLRDHRPYAICAFAGAWVLVLAEQVGVPQGWALVIGAAAASSLRVLALVSGYTLPRWSSDS